MKSFYNLSHPRSPRVICPADGTPDLSNRCDSVNRVEHPPRPAGRSTLAAMSYDSLRRSPPAIPAISAIPFVALATIIIVTTLGGLDRHAEATPASRATATATATVPTSTSTSRTPASAPHTKRSTHHRIALLPTERLNLTPAEGRHLRHALVGILQHRRQIVLIDDAKVAKILLDHPKDCVQRPTCQRGLATALAASGLLVLRAGQLGQTLMLRLTLIDAEGVKKGSWQEVLHDRKEASLTRSLEHMVNSLAPRPLAILPPPRPWYRRWWIWTAVGVVVTGAVTTAVLLSRDTGPHADVGIVLPPH